MLTESQQWHLLLNLAHSHFYPAIYVWIFLCFFLCIDTFEDEVVTYSTTSLVNILGGGLMLQPLTTAATWYVSWLIIIWIKVNLLAFVCEKETRWDEQTDKHWMEDHMCNIYFWAMFSWLYSFFFEWKVITFVLNK